MEIRLATLEDCESILKGQKEAYASLTSIKPPALEETVETIKQRINSIEWLLYIGIDNNSIVSGISYCISYLTNSAYACRFFSNEPNAGKKIFDETINDNKLKELGIEKVFLRTPTGDTRVRYFLMRDCRMATQSEFEECEKIFGNKIPHVNHPMDYLVYDLKK